MYTHRKIVDLRRHHRDNFISRFLEKRYTNTGSFLRPQQPRVLLKVRKVS